MLSIGELFGLPEENRADPIAESAENFFSKFELPKLYSELSIEHPDAETGKVLSKFCRSIERAIENRLRKRGFKQVFKTLNTPIPKLHILFKSYDSCYIAISRRNLGIGWPCGIPRLRFDKDAPSRSALKLEEALMVFLSAQQRERLVGTGTTAVDLGAAPGGWTYVFHKRGSQVTAIDNGRLDAKLFADGRIKHLQEDAFRYKPNSPVDWLLCDVIESPFRITELIAEWFTRGLCTRAIVNLKLPMKDKLDCVNECIARLEEINNIRICAKHLYHDRDEITVFLSYV